MHYCVPGFTLRYSFLRAQFKSCFFLFAVFSPTVSEKDWWPGENPSFSKKGGGGEGGGFLSLLLKFQSLLLQSATIKQNKGIVTERGTCSGGQRVWTEERLMVYIAQCNCHMEVKLRSF